MRWWYWASMFLVVSLTHIVRVSRHCQQYLGCQENYHHDYCLGGWQDVVKGGFSNDLSKITAICDGHIDSRTGSWPCLYIWSSLASKPSSCLWDLFVLKSHSNLLKRSKENHLWYYQDFLELLDCVLDAKDVDPEEHAKLHSSEQAPLAKISEASSINQIYLHNK